MELRDIVGAILALGIFIVVAYAAIISENKDATLAIVGLLGTVVGFYLRGRVEPPTP